MMDRSDALAAKLMLTLTSPFQKMATRLLAIFVFTSTTYRLIITATSTSTV